MSSTGLTLQAKQTQLALDLSSVSVPSHHLCSFLESIKRNTSPSLAVWILSEVLHNLVQNHGSCLTHENSFWVYSFLNRHSHSLKESSNSNGEIAQWLGGRKESIAAEVGVPRAYLGGSHKTGLRQSLRELLTTEPRSLSITWSPPSQGPPVHCLKMTASALRSGSSSSMFKNP